MGFMSAIGRLHLIGAVVFLLGAIGFGENAYRYGFASYKPVVATGLFALFAVYCFQQWRGALDDEGSYEEQEAQLRKSARNGAHGYPY